MKEAVGSYFLTTIVITFIVLFTGYMCLSINMNKAYKVKNEVINIIQKNNGLNSEAIGQIQDYMTKIGYRTTGNCNAHFNKNEGQFDGYGISGTSTKTKNTVFCVRPVTTVYTTKDDVSSQFPPAEYYQIKVFFGIDLPIVRNMFSFSLQGSTKKLFCPSTLDGKYAKQCR